MDTYEVTSAKVHDSQPTENLLREEDRGQKLYADSAYIGDKILAKNVKSYQDLNKKLLRIFRTIQTANTR